MSKADSHDDFTGVDWRTRTVTTLLTDMPATAGGAPSHKAGSLARQSTIARSSDGQYLDFVLPSASALALSIAISSADRATELRGQIEFSDAVSPFGDSKSVVEESTSELFDYFESYFTCAIFSFLALEVFANEVISQNPNTLVTTNRGACGKKKLVTLRAEQLESKSSTEEKLADVLPAILKKDTPKGQVPWEAFRKLQRARNEVVHMKAKDSNPRLERPEQLEHGTLLARAFEEDVWEMPKAAVEMIGYFEVETLDSKWLQHAKSIVNRRSAIPRHQPLSGT